jgi:hypothetical protein
MPPQGLNNYAEVNADAVLAKAFDFGTFMNITKLHNIMVGYKSTSKNYDMRIVKHYIENMTQAFYDKADRDSDMFLVYAGDAIFKTCFEHSMIPYFSKEFQQAFTSTNVAQVEGIHEAVERLVMSIEAVGVLDPKTAQGKDAIIKSKAESYFQFGETFYIKSSDFKTAEFKNKLAPQLMESFFPFFYYRYLNEKLSACPDANMRCKRIYKLAKYVFLYFSLMSVFLAVYANEQDIEKYKQANNEDDIVVNEKRQKLVYIMDSILIQMNNEEMQDNGTNNDLATFYTNIKRMSLENIQSSNNLVELSREVDILQNNLANYNNMQNMNFQTRKMSQITFFVNLIVWLLVVVFVVGSTMLQNVKNAWADVVTIVAVVVVILYWMGVFKRVWRFTSVNVQTFMRGTKKT